MAWADSIVSGAAAGWDYGITNGSSCCPVSKFLPYLAGMVTRPPGHTAKKRPGDRGRIPAGEGGARRRLPPGGQPDAARQARYQLGRPKPQPHRGAGSHRGLPRRLRRPGVNGDETRGGLVTATTAGDIAGSPSRSSVAVSTPPGQTKSHLGSRAMYSPRFTTAVLRLHVDKARVMTLERHHESVRRTISMLGDNDVRLARSR